MKTERAATKNTAAALIVETVEKRSQMTEFIRMPYSIYRDDKNWTPPLEADVRKTLDPRKHPFLEFGKVKLFLARRADRVVGRIAAVVDPRFNEYHGTNYGFFGFFECIDDIDVARALFEAAEDYLDAYGFETVIGPMSYSTNYDCGILVSGFDVHPGVMMPHNPEYYPRLLEECGFRKEKDLWSWDIPMQEDCVAPAEAVFADKILQNGKDTRSRSDITVRPMDFKHYDADLAKLRKIYCSAWSDNWGFVPTTNNEFQYMGKQLKPLMKPEFALIAEFNGQPVATAIAFFDPGPALRAARGRMTRFGLPIGLFHLLRADKTARRLRFILLGIVAEHRYPGLAPMMIEDVYRAAYRLGYRDPMEGSWILENNRGLNRLIEDLGGILVRKHRIYSRAMHRTRGA
ncbi:N-acetyltransferase [Streptomyces sp. NPDC047072]|uniref:N-acetyltransferase n=1 Tax=Streptomyces sp. NPDC047072 TaxID=3154809 RepID=UPI0034058AE3